MTDSMGNMAMVRNISLMMTDAEGSTGGSGDTGGSACAGEAIIVVLFFGTIYFSRKAVCSLINWASDYVIDSLASKVQTVAQTQVIAGSTPASPPPGNNNGGKKESRRSDKEKSSDKPSWVNRNDIDFSQTPQQNATRLMNQKYGVGNWKRGCREFSQIVKWIKRGVLPYLKLK